MKIGIVKYGMGNVASVQKVLKKIGYESIISSDFNELKATDILLLPGVGSFQKGMENLHSLGLVNFLTQEVIKNKKPFIGICLGMQLIASIGTEPEKVNGLGWIKGEVLKINSKNNFRLPHMGWNSISLKNKNQFYTEFHNQDFYFIHNYHFNPENKDDIIFTVDYDGEIVAALEKDNIYAMQFHPEKSQEVGMQLLNKIISYYA